MNKLLYLLFASIFSLDWLTFKIGILPRLFTWLPEILSVIAALIVLALATKRKGVIIDLKYIFFFYFFFMIIIVGIIINNVQAGTVFVGLRIYAKYLPFFFLPFVYKFSENEIKGQLRFLLVLSLIQLPVTLYQRFIKYSGVLTGDVVGGTLGPNTSGVLSVYLGCAIGITVASYLKKEIPKHYCILIIPALIVPTMLNETKITLLLIPFFLLAPVWFAGGAKQMYRIMISAVIASIALIIFIQVYDHFQVQRGKDSLIEFITKEGRVAGHLYMESNPGEKLARFDAIVLGAQQLLKEDKFLVGIGIGNASISFSDKFTGEYYKKYEYLEPLKVFFTRVMWEMGVLGILIYMWFFVAIILDSLRLRSKEGVVGALALGWIPVSMVMAASFLYFKTFDDNLFAYLFWYFSGYLAAEKMWERNNVLQNTRYKIA